MIELIDPFYNGVENEDIVKRISELMYEIQKDGVFAGKINRFALSYYAYLIAYNNNDIGFIYATEEHRYPNGLFIDMALLKEYRNKGIGKKVLDMFVNKHNDTLMFSEVLSNNISSNKISNDIGVRLDNGMYLFPKEKYSEFVESGEINNFYNATSKPELNATQVLRRIKNDR